MASSIETKKMKEENILVLSEIMVKRCVLGGRGKQFLSLVEDPGVQLDSIYYSSATFVEGRILESIPFVKSSNSSA